MARPLRIELNGGLYHVTSRGDRREPIFLDDNDRKLWLEIFSQVCRQFNWVCHAWCQMTNHYHVVVETVEGNLCAGMRQLNGIYTQAFNRKHRKVGHVFQGRYKAILVEKDSHLLELARYVVLNPVRAKIVGDPGHWQWSSYLAMLGTYSPPTWLQTDWLLGQFGSDRINAITEYINFVRSGVGLPSLWESVQAQLFLGSEEFILKMREKIQHEGLEEIPRVQRRPIAKPLSHFVVQFQARNEGMIQAYASGDYSLA